MSRMFIQNINFNQDISSWDVSSVTDMSGGVSSMAVASHYQDSQTACFDILADFTDNAYIYIENLTTRRTAFFDKPHGQPRVLHSRELPAP